MRPVLTLWPRWWLCSLIHSYSMESCVGGKNCSTIRKSGPIFFLLAKDDAGTVIRINIPRLWTQLRKRAKLSASRNHDFRSMSEIKNNVNVLTIYYYPNRVSRVYIISWVLITRSQRRSGSPAFSLFWGGSSIKVCRSKDHGPIFWG